MKPRVGNTTGVQFPPPAGEQAASGSEGSSDGDENEPKPVKEGVKPHLPPAGKKTASGSGGSSDGDENEPKPEGVKEGVKHHVPPPAGEKTASGSGDSNDGDENEPNPDGVEEGMALHVPPMAGEQTASSSGGSSEHVAGNTKGAAKAVQSGGDQNNPEPKSVEDGFNLHVSPPAGEQIASGSGGSSKPVAVAKGVAESVQSGGDQSNTTPRGVGGRVKPHVPPPAGEQTPSSSGGSSEPVVGNTKGVAKAVQSGGDQNNPKPKGGEEGFRLLVSPPAGEQTASGSGGSSKPVAGDTKGVAKAVQSRGDQRSPTPEGVEEGFKLHVPPLAGEQTTSGSGDSSEPVAGDTKGVAKAAQSNTEKQTAGRLTPTGNDKGGTFGGNGEYDSFVAGGQNAADVAQSGLGRSSPTPRK